MKIKEMYSLLTRVPLLMGINGQELARMEASLDFQVVMIPPSSRPVIAQGELCSNLYILLSGEMSCERVSPDRLYSTLEYLQGPTQIEAENLYGLLCKFNHSYKAHTTCMMISISKHKVSHFMAKSEIFRINYINLLASLAGKLRQQSGPTRENDIRQKVVRFLLQSFSTPDPRKILRIKMNDLASYLDETRLSISQTLNDMNDSGLIQLKRKEIHIPDFQKIIERK